MIHKINAIDIPDAWFQCLDKLIDYGVKYTNQVGSFEGDQRIELDLYVVMQINFPYNNNYNLMLPKMPPQLSIPDPVSPGYVEQYMPYLMTDAISPNEEYTYGSRIHEQIYYWINTLKNFPNTNQAILQVAQPGDFKLKDPPCLRHIDIRIRDNKFHFYPVFRSWDLWGGFPANLAGIAVLQKFMADEIGCEMGKMIPSTKGLHIYSYVEELAEIRTNKK